MWKLGPTGSQALLMERSGLGSLNGIHHIVEIAGSIDTSTTTSHGRHINGIEIPQQENRHNGARLTVSEPPVLTSTTSASSRSNTRNSSSRRGNTRRRTSPVHSALWISVEFVLLVIQIIASIIVLSLSRHEHPRTPLFEWIVGYAIGCAATLPLLHWRYYHHNHIREQDSFQSQQTSRINDPPGALSSSRTNEDDQAVILSSRSNQASTLTNIRMKTLMEYFKISLDCFFAVWFVVGNVWIFGGHSSAYDAPNLYRLCIVFLVFSCIGYAMPFILCSTICCCLPCIISILGVREDLTQNRGASSESINALPTFKFKMKKNKRSGESHCAAAEGGVMAAGTEKERVITGEDAVCCICLAKYENNDELRELPCSHIFHKECVDKWLKINALCPLCKSEVGENLTKPNSGENASQQRLEVRVENGVSNTAV